MQQNKKELAHYMVAGACSTTIDLSCFMACLNHLHYSVHSALAISFTIGVLCNFIICNLFIFKRNTTLIKALSTHYSANVSSLIIQNIGLSLLKNTMLIDHLIITRLMISSITFLLNFFLIKHFAFNSFTPHLNRSDTQNTVEEHGI